MSVLEAVKRWVSTNRSGFIAVSGVMALTFISLQLAEFFPGSKDGQTVAAWFQAVGSIAAILGASYFAMHQLRETRRLAEQLEADRLKRRWSSVKAIVDALYQQCLDVSGEFEGEAPEFRFSAFSQSYDGDRFSRALRRIDEAPLFELDSDALVTAITGFKEEADRLRSCVNCSREHMRARTDTTSALDFPEGFLKEQGRLTVQAVTAYYLAIQSVTGGAVLNEPRRFEPYC